MGMGTGDTDGGGVNVVGALAKPAPLQATTLQARRSETPTPQMEMQLRPIRHLVSRSEDNATLGLLLAGFITRTGAKDR
jgi:hypothetical protein